MPVLLFIVILLIILVWIGGFIYSNDFSVKTIKIPSDINKVLVVFPHADDEALSTGGFISGLTGNGIDVYWMILTKGEKGTPNGQVDDKLKKIRADEAKKAAVIYNIHTLIQKNYPDGGVEEKRKLLMKDLRDTIKTINPDLVISYDLSGLYGHPDHISTSEVITEIVKNNSKIKLWYVSFPKRILDTISLPIHMAKDVNFLKRRMYPTHKIWVGLSGVMNKIKVSYVYESQGVSSSRNMPFPFIPFWFYISLTPFEYFYEGIKFNDWRSV